MAIFKLKRKNYSDEGGGIGSAVLGTLGTLGTLYGAKKGMLGNNIQMAVNKGVMSVGKGLGNKAIFKSGATDYSKGFVNNISNNMKMTGGKGLNNMQKSRAIVTNRSNLLKNFDSSINKSTVPSIIN